jgi:ABC-2 type transport system permease protein
MLSLIRDRQALFFSVAMPLIFLLIFGPMLSGSERDRPIQVAVFVSADGPSAQLFEEALGQFSRLESIHIDTQEGAAQAVAHEGADFGLIWDGSVLEVLLNPAMIQDNSTYRQISEGVRSYIDQQRLQPQELLEVSVVRHAVRGEAYSSTGYVFPGIIAMGVMSSGLFLISSSFMYMKESFVLKRLLATPLGKLQFLAGLITTRISLSILSAVLILAAGPRALGVELVVNWPLLVVYLLLATVIMAGAGALVALIARSARSASEISSVLMTLMMFASGVYFPLEFLPASLRAVGSILPATYVARGFRFIMGVESMTWPRFVLETTILTLAALTAIWFAAVRGSWDLE